MKYGMLKARRQYLPKKTSIDQAKGSFCLHICVVENLPVMMRHKEIAKVFCLDMTLPIAMTREGGC
jgi:hypothetical protein